MMHQNDLMRSGGVALDGGEYEFISAAEEEEDQQRHKVGSPLSAASPGSPSLTPGGEGGAASQSELRSGWQGWLIGGGGGSGTTTGASLEQLAHSQGTPQTRVERIQALLRFRGVGGGDLGGGESGDGGDGEGGFGGDSDNASEGGAADLVVGSADSGVPARTATPMSEEALQAAREHERAAQERVARGERMRARLAREKEIARRKAALEKRIEQQHNRAKQQRDEEQSTEGEGGEDGEGMSGAAQELPQTGQHQWEGEESAWTDVRVKVKSEVSDIGAGGTGKDDPDMRAVIGDVAGVGDGEAEKAKAKERSPHPRVPRRAGGGGAGGGNAYSSSTAGADEHLNRGEVLAVAEDTNYRGGNDSEVNIGDVPSQSLVVASQPITGTHLTPKVQRILKRLVDLPAVLTSHRLREHSRISCGGTGAVAFKTWNGFLHTAENITRTLPSTNPLLPSVAEYVQQHCRHRGACNFTKMYEMVTPEEMVRRPPPSCAIVGNGGRLRYEIHGEAIDAADVVVRFNNGRTKGFERQVGRRSHFRFYNGPSVEPKQSGELTVAQLRDPAVGHWVKQYIKHRENFPEAYIIDPEIICHAWDMVDREGDKPSSGLVGIAWAMRMCRSVDVYGFQFDAYFNETMRPHYYDWERPKPGREHAHPFERERNLYLALAAAGLLTLH